MANTCDYCHKPLSLMRRLRGEQFCSVEHLDLYSAQQAEFALERLAASVTDRPNTERPPALIRPVSKPVPAAAQAGGTELEAAPQPVETRVAIEADPGTPEPEYPLAPHLEQARIAARTIEIEERRRPKPFEPVETWGKVESSWAIPQFRAEPGDPRTWNAGKLVSRIPPLAGLRGLVNPKAPEADEVAAALEFEQAAEAELPAWQVASTSGMLSVLPPFRRDIGMQPGRGVAAEAEPAPPVSTAAIVTRAFPVAFRNRLEPAARILTAVNLQPESVRFHALSEAEFSSSPVYEIQLAQPGRPFLAAGVTRETALTAAGSEGFSRGSCADAAGPHNALVLPRPEPWTWASTLAVPQVALPDLKARAIPAQVVGRDAQWQNGTAEVRRPAPLWPAPQFGHSGPAFGWEGSQPKAWDSDTRKAVAAPLASRGAPRLHEVHARVQVGLPAAERQSWREWQVLRPDSSQMAAEALSPTRSTVTAFAVRVQTPTVFSWARLEGARELRGSAAFCPGEGVPPVPASNPEAQTVAPRLRKLAGPVALFPCTPVQMMEPVSHGVRAEVAGAGPAKYSPVELVVVPPPQFLVRTPALNEEVRYVALAPNGVWRLPRVRHTGYRAVGPFPKLPVRMPDRYLHAVEPEMHPAILRVPRTPVSMRQDFAGLPAVQHPQDSRMPLHPADYFAWPVPKGTKPERLLPEREFAGPGPATVRRFGPGRAGLQGKRGNADLLPRTGA